MTVEEIEIVVTAKVEDALKKFPKILPAMRNVIKQVQAELASIDMSGLQKAAKQQIPLFKKQIQGLKKSIESNEIAIKVTNEDAMKQIDQVKKGLNALHKQNIIR